MSRWHRADCSLPRIEVEDGVPKCHSCGQAPRLADDNTPAAAASCPDAPAIPPDEPLGHFNLWWPRSVTYSNSDPVSTIFKRIELGEGGSSQHNTPEVTGLTPSPVAAAYPESLQPHEIRLLVLKTIEKGYDFPIHVDLEVYRVDDCPEYETVSYTWAGEDGNAASQHPVYVGPFWDVLLQTRNCWEMLRFMRPWRQGNTRTLWVDAICINQNDVLERSTQVANMGRIYSGCSRVNVYLGPDIAIPLHALHKKHPRRFPLHQLETGEITPEFPVSQQEQAKPRDRVTLKSLLRRRYFSRLWIIQELILSCNILIRVGDVDFWADGAMPSHLSALSGWSWEDLPTPWAQHLSHGGPLGHERELSELLVMSSQAEAADPRDRVFGLLGLLRQKAPPQLDAASPFLLQRSRIDADYSLSCRNVYLGVFSHCLLNSEFPYVLFRACGLSGTGHLDAAFPSWAPDWDSPETWSRLLMIPELQSVLAKEHIIKNGLYKERDPNLEDVVIHEFKTSASVAENPWPSGASVCSKTGALHINLTQCLILKIKPIRVSQMDGFHVFLVYQDLFQVYIFSEYRLDEMALSGREEVFALEVDGNSSVYLILEPRDVFNASFKLVATCPYVCIAHAHRERRKTFGDLDLRVLQSGNLHNHLHDIRWLLQQEIESKSWGAQACLRRNVSVAQIFRLYLSLLYDTESGESVAPSAFMDAYLDCMPQEHQAKIENGYLLLTVEEDYWDHCHWTFCGEEPELDLEYHWEFRRRTHGLSETDLKYDWSGRPPSEYCDNFEFDKKIRDPRQDPNWAFIPSCFRKGYAADVPGVGADYYYRHPMWAHVDRSGGCVKLRYPIASFVRDFKIAGGPFKKVRFSLESLSNVAARTGEGVREMLERTPMEEDKNVWCVRWSDETSMVNDIGFRNAMGMTGLMSKVKIC